MSLSCSASQKRWGTSADNEARLNLGIHLAYLLKDDICLFLTRDVLGRRFLFRVATKNIRQTQELSYRLKRGEIGPLRHPGELKNAICVIQRELAKSRSHLPADGDGCFEMSFPMSTLFVQLAFAFATVTGEFSSRRLRPRCATRNVTSANFSSDEMPVTRSRLFKWRISRHT